jgi:hypothetical protein
MGPEIPETRPHQDKGVIPPNHSEGQGARELPRAARPPPHGRIRSRARQARGAARQHVSESIAPAETALLHYRDPQPDDRNPRYRGVRRE